ncbi:MAG TPA: YjbQ family protein [Streptosporangiaceae bacterium]|jgi:secondary thiamine-phosphate synthase enzyme|nr:YjbQ family protein [Streptosporangiaceae bacterium]
MKTEIIEVRTGNREGVFDLTGDCESFVARAAADGSGGSGDRGDGMLNVFVPHATAGLAVIELGAGSDQDLLSVLADVLPADDRWRHAHGSRGHGRSHVLPAFLPPYATIPVVNGRLALGTWQSIALVDLNVDNHVRQIRLSFF